MKNHIKFFLLFTAICLLSTRGLAFPQGLDRGLQFKADTLSVNLKAVPLKAVLDAIKKEKGIWFKNIGDDSLVEARISDEFTDVPFEKALTRLLALANYLLTFDQKGNASGLILLGKKVPRQNTSPPQVVHPAQLAQAPPPSTQKQETAESLPKKSQPPGEKLNPTPPSLLMRDGSTMVAHERDESS